MQIQNNTIYNYHPNFTSRRFSKAFAQELESKIVELYSKGEKCSKIAENLQVSEPVVSKILKRLSLKASDIQYKYNKLKKKSFNELSFEDVKKTYNYSDNKLSCIYTKLKEPLRLTKRKELCELILQMQAEGLTVSEIAKRINKTPQTINRYISYAKSIDLVG